jgi:plastocyanin
LACAVAAAAVPALPAAASNQTVTVSSDQFDPGTVTILQGESVSWNNTGGGHNVHFDDNSYTQPPTPDTSSWSVSRTFLTPGTYRYYCDAHGGPNGAGMSGTVTVLPSGSPPPPPPPVTDKSAPRLLMSGKTTQRVLRQRGLRLVVRVDENAAVLARARVSIPGASRLVRTKDATAQLVAGRDTKMRLEFSRKSLRALRGALRKRSRLTARLTVTATDKAANKRILKNKFALRR